MKSASQLNHEARILKSSAKNETEKKLAGLCADLAKHVEQLEREMKDLQAKVTRIQWKRS